MPGEGFQQRPALLRIPQELREHVFELVLDDSLLEGLDHPYDALPSHSRFKQLSSLLEVSRQINADVGTLFRRRYADRITFHFDNGSEVHLFHRKYGRLAAVQCAHFSLRSGNDFSGENPPWLEARFQDNSALILEQPSLAPLLQHGLRGHMGHLRFRSPNCPLCSPNDTSCVKYSEIRHYPCPRGPHCISFEQYEYRIVGASTPLRLYGFCWEVPKPRQFAHFGANRIRQGCMILQGRLCDMGMEDVVHAPEPSPMETAYSGPDAVNN